MVYKTLREKRQLLLCDIANRSNDQHVLPASSTITSIFNFGVSYV